MSSIVNIACVNKEVARGAKNALEREVNTRMHMTSRSNPYSTSYFLQQVNHPKDIYNRDIFLGVHGDQGTLLPEGSTWCIFSSF